MYSKRVYLNENDIITLKCEKYKIFEVIGEGTSSIVYTATSLSNSNKVIIKELYPLYLAISRNSDNSLFIPEDSMEYFDSYRISFECSNRLQREFLNNDDTANYTFSADASYECNNTLYYIMGRVVGKSYDTVCTENIESVLEICKSVANAVKFYHQKNYLHLDIKPSNIFIIKETNQLIKLFDFDTVCHKSDVLDLDYCVRYTQDYAAPELKASRLTDIDETTDLFSIGAILYSRIFDTPPDERVSRPRLRLDYSKCGLLQEKSPLLKEALTEIFHKTLCVVKKCRYENANELILALDNALELAKIKVYLCNQNIRPATSCGYYVSRKNEIRKIRNIFETKSNIVYLCGIGGIGKSETAREYAQYCKSNNIYDTVQLTLFKGSLKETIARLEFAGINDEFLSLNDSYENKIYQLAEKHLNTSRTLIIIDNYNLPDRFTYGMNPDSEIISKLKKLNINILFTTRTVQTDSACIVNIGELTTDELKQIFFKINSKEKTDIVRQNKVEELIDIVAGHTLTVDLVAHLTAEIESHKMRTLDDYIAEIRKLGLNNEVKCSVHSNKDEKDITSVVYTHIAKLFRFTELTEEEIYIMTNACLLPISGMKIEEFCEFINVTYSPWYGNETINSLIRNGWIKTKDTENKTCLFVHPIISDVAYNELKPDISENKCRSFIQNLEYKIKETENDYRLAAEYIDVALNAGNVIAKYECSDTDKKLSADFLTAVANYACKFGLYKEAYSNYIKALDIRKNLSDNFLDITLSYNDISNYYGYTGEYEKSLDCALKALNLRVELLPPNHISLLDSYLNVGICYNHLGEYSKGLDYIKKAGANASENLPEYSEQTANIYSYMGSTYRSLGKYNKALKYEVKTIEIREKILAENHPAMASAYLGIGLTYQKIGNYNDALEYMKKALKIRKCVLPENHPYIASAYKEIGSLYGNLGKLEKSLEYKVKALEIREKALPPMHPLLAGNYNDIGVSYSQKGDYKKALEYEIKALTIKERILPPKHPDLATSYGNIGTSYSKLGDYEKALKYRLKALEIREKVLP